jgi:predicted glycoside hydrolase/deacetylase ChbG (UPF0249 family)
MKILIVNADDYGRTPEVSRGIRYAHIHGVVSTTTVMVNLPGAAKEIAIAMQETPELALGVHLNLTTGPPCSKPEDVPGLLGDRGQFLNKSLLFNHPDHIDATEVENEWHAQVDAFLSIGAQLDHLDSHHHIAAWSPTLWETFLSLAERYQCGIRYPIPADVTWESLLDLIPLSTHSWARHELGQRTQSAGPIHPDQFLAGFFGSGAKLEQLHAMIREVPEGVSEIMCHPGFVDTALTDVSKYTDEREIELEALIHPETHRLLLDNNIHLRNFRNAWDHSLNDS